MDRTLVTGTTILDGSGAAPFAGDVLIEGERIAAVQRGGGLPRGDALAALAAMVGAVALARATHDRALAAELLAAVQRRVLPRRAAH